MFRNYLFFFCIAFVLIFMVRTSAQNTMQVGAESHEAHEIWERAIESKGGRRLLNEVTNIALTETVKRNGKSVIQSSSLLQFGIGSWDWVDLRPSHFGVSVSLYNFEERTFFDTNSDLVLPNRSELPPDNNLESQVYAMAPYILESKEVKPKLLTWQEVKVGKEFMDRVRTAWPGTPDRYIDFTFSRVTKLPVKIQFLHFRGDKELSDSNIELFDYHNVNGIAVPSRIKIGGEVRVLDLGFNVEIKSDFFNTSPSIKAGPIAWKKSANE